VGDDLDRDGAIRGRPGDAPKLANTMSPLVLDGYPAVIPQTIGARSFALLLPPAEASAGRHLRARASISDPVTRPPLYPLVSS
jgi:hypothetical protein